MKPFFSLGSFSSLEKSFIPHPQLDAAGLKIQIAFSFSFKVLSWVNYC